MLLFSIILDIKSTLTKEAFINLVLEWNQGFVYNVQPGIQIDYRTGESRKIQ